MFRSSAGVSGVVAMLLVGAWARPVRDTIALDGARHLEAFGVPIGDLNGLPWQPVGGVSSKASPLDVDAIEVLLKPLALNDRGAADLKAAPGGAATCVNTSSNVFRGCGNFTCHACVSPDRKTIDVNCTIPGTSVVGRASGPNNATQVILTAYINLGLQLDAGPDHQDCSCQQGFNGTVLTGCAFGSAVCEYIEPSTDPNGVIHSLAASFRAKAWRWEHTSYVGASQGWAAPFRGYDVGTDGAGGYLAVTDAVSNLKAEHPAVALACGTKLPPLVVVPGLTSANLNYRLTKSAPPAWAFWCEHNTDGWEPLWPIADSGILTSPTKFLCWSADIAVAFDSTTRTFGPARKGCETELVDFGSFDGIGGLGFIAGLAEMVGWQSGKSLFAAPFDWRVPSVGQDEFYAKLKALIEQTSAANGNAKVVLWAFSFGPQYTLSFLHRMTEPWKDQYIEWFMASSPVWGGAPTALTAYVAGVADIGGGGGGPYPNPPAECKRYTMIEGTCYTGLFRSLQVAKDNDIGACCELAGNQSALQIFNFFPDNGTCALVDGYVGTAPCPAGVLGYVGSGDGDIEPSDGALGGREVAKKPAGPGPPGPSDPQTKLIRTLAQASPSLMWAFPRAGTDANTSWTKDDVLIKTPSKSYTAFDIAELFADIDQAKNIDLLDYLSTEPDLATLAAPGVATFVSYGTELPTLSSIEFGTDLKKGAPAPTALKNSTTEDGDGLVPARSSVRAYDMWLDAQAGLGKRLLYEGFPKQQHAACFLNPTGETPAQQRDCFEKIMALIME